MAVNSLKKLSPDTRLRKIRQILLNKQRVDIAELAESFGVSEITVRRDLEKLEQHGLLQRTIGGAIPAERMAFDFNFAQRRQTRQKEKQAIVREALKVIQPGHRLILDTGTTTLELAYLLKDLRDVTVITPSLAVASVLQFSRNIQTILLGGIFRQGSADLTGSVTEDNLDMFAVDIVFQGADGIGLDGTLYNADLRLARVDQKMRQRAAEKQYWYVWNRCTRHSNFVAALDYPSVPLWPGDPAGSRFDNSIEESRHLGVRKHRPGNHL